MAAETIAEEVLLGLTVLAVVAQGLLLAEGLQWRHREKRGLLDLEFEVLGRLVFGDVWVYWPSVEVFAHAKVWAVPCILEAYADVLLNYGIVIEFVWLHFNTIKKKCLGKSLFTKA